MNDDFPGSLKTLLQHLCGMRYHVSSPLDLNSHIAVYIVADKYELPALQKLAAEKLRSCLALNKDRPPALMLQALRNVLTLMPESDIHARSAQTKHCRDFISALRNDDDFESILSEFPESAVTLVLMGNTAGTT